MFGGIRSQVARMIQDDTVSHALRNGGNDMQNGIMSRCIDYDRDFKLSKLGLTADQRAIAALYIYSKEVKSIEYEQLERAVRKYATDSRTPPPFVKVDGHISWSGGQMNWTH